MVEFVEIESQLGGELTLFRDGRKTGARSGGLVQFATAKGEQIVLVRPGTVPEQYKRTVAASPSR